MSFTMIQNKDVWISCYSINPNQSANKLSAMKIEYENFPKIITEIEELTELFLTHYGKRHSNVHVLTAYEDFSINNVQEIHKLADESKLTLSVSTQSDILV